MTISIPAWLTNWKIINAFLLILALTSLGAVAATNSPEKVTYKSQISDHNIVFSGDGFLDSDGVPDDVYVWTSSDGVSRGYWYKTSADANHIYLQMDSSMFGDLELVVKGDSIFWPNGSEWVRAS